MRNNPGWSRSGCRSWSGCPAARRGWCRRATAPAGSSARGSPGRPGPVRASPRPSPSGPGISRPRRASNRYALSSIKAVQIQTTGGFGAIRRPYKVASSSTFMPYFGTSGLERVASGVGDQARVDAELAAQRHEQPGSLGPEPFGLGGHAPQQHVVRPGERLGQPADRNEPGGTS